MSRLIKMHFYVTKTPNGEYHVQNAILGRLGQHHVHNKTSFERWKEGINSDAIEIEQGTCNCGLEVGEVRDHDGNVWKTAEFKEGKK